MSAQLITQYAIVILHIFMRFDWGFDRRDMDDEQVGFKVQHFGQRYFDVTSPSSYVNFAI